MTWMTRDANDWDSDSPGLAVLIYDILSFLGFFFLLAVLLPAAFSKKIKRRRTWFSLIISWMMFAFSYLCLVGNQSGGDEPHFGTCLFQTLLVYSVPPLVASTGFYFILDMYLELRNTIFRGSDVSSAYRDSMVLTPWVLWVLMIMTTAFLINDPTQISRESTDMYCHSNTGAQLAVTLCVTFPLAASCILLEVLMAHLLYRHWTIFRRYCVDKASDSRSGRISLSMIIRIFCFTSVPLAALGLASFVAAHQMESNATWNILLASLPILAALSFGTQKDIIRAWMFCFPSRRDTKKHIETPSYRHLSSPIFSPLPSPGLGEDWSSRQSNVFQYTLPIYQHQSLLSIERIQSR
ncbi:uncharacterized protein EV420DRAFT_1013207 [Desarmillaria tabescens]|uniref:Uncharacterized protein n=1 Tax=Armillaria tabescens TaxID=1929756 RepID=A0AA39JKH6_ARMTA|nr:uncharacterized protein EV420DRAFT_1013207 [Desarmillaria tabescens]KAK0443892.1 hypothetical protein EV420DRAFT_1013207 [Desarmillaria tabescens]